MHEEPGFTGSNEAEWGSKEDREMKKESEAKSWGLQGKEDAFGVEAWWLNSVSPKEDAVTLNL